MQSSERVPPGPGLQARGNVGVQSVREGLPTKSAFSHSRVCISEVKPFDSASSEPRCQVARDILHLKQLPRSSHLAPQCQMQQHLGSSGVFITQTMFPEHLLLPASVQGCSSEQNRYGSAPSSQIHVKDGPRGCGGWYQGSDAQAEA